MSDQNDFELFTGPAPSEKGEKNDEKFNEEMRHAQQAIQQLRKEEGHVKSNDHNLAVTIVQFLHQPENTDLFLLVSRAVAQDIPSELLIAIFSLIDEKAHSETKGLLEAGHKGKGAAETAVTIHRKADFESLSHEHKKTIDTWVANMAIVAAQRPHRVLESIVSPDRIISSILIQLSAFVLRNYLSRHTIQMEYQSLYDFMQEVFVQIIKEMETLVKEQKQLK